MHTQQHQTLLDAVEPDFRVELQRHLHNHRLGSYEEEFLTRVKRGQSVRELLTWALSVLPADDARPAEDIATMFLVISELKTATDEESDIAMDAMVFSKNTPDFPAPSTRKELERRRDELVARPFASAAASTSAGRP